MNERDERSKALNEWSPLWTHGVAAAPAPARTPHNVRDASSNTLEPNPADYSKELMPGRIAITSRRKIVFVDLADVAAVEARCNYVVLRTLCGEHALRQPISAIAEDIEQYGFVRIHRSTIVNGRFVEEIRTSASGKMFVRLKGFGSGYQVSRKYRTEVRQFASRCTYRT